MDVYRRENRKIRNILEGKRPRKPRAVVASDHMFNLFERTRAGGQLLPSAANCIYQLQQLPVTGNWSCRWRLLPAATWRLIAFEGAARLFYFAYWQSCCCCLQLLATGCWLLAADYWLTGCCR